MKLAPAIALFLLLVGCAPSQLPITAEDALSITLRNAHHNLRDDRARVYIIALPLTPEVTTAIGRLHQLKAGLSDSAAYEWVYTYTRFGSGLHLDRDGTLYDERGHRSDWGLDSLFVVVQLTNQTWPCDAPTIANVPLLRSSDVPCVQPPIDDIADHIYLTSGGDTIHPVLVGGRRDDVLRGDERLWVLFDLGGHALREFTLTVDAFRDIQPISRWGL